MAEQLPKGLYMPPKDDGQSAPMTTNQHADDGEYQDSTIAPYQLVKPEAIPRSMAMPWIDDPELPHSIFDFGSATCETSDRPEDPAPMRYRRGGKRSASSEDRAQVPISPKRAKGLENTLAPSPVLSPYMAPIRPSIKKEDITLDTDFTLPSPELRALLADMQTINPMTADPVDAQFPLLSPVLRPLLEPLKVSPVIDPAKMTDEEVIEALAELDRMPTPNNTNGATIPEVDSGEGLPVSAEDIGHLDGGIKEEDVPVDHGEKKEDKKKKRGPRKPRAKKESSRTKNQQRSTAESSPSMRNNEVSVQETVVNQETDRLATLSQQISQEQCEEIAPFKRENGASGSDNSGIELIQDGQQIQWEHGGLEPHDVPADHMTPMPPPDAHAPNGFYGTVPSGFHNEVTVNVEAPFQFGHAGHSAAVFQGQFHFPQHSFPPSPSPFPWPNNMLRAPTTPVHGSNISPMYTPHSVPHENGPTPTDPHNPVQYQPPFHHPFGGSNGGNGHDMHHEQVIPQYLPVHHHHHQQHHVAYQSVISNAQPPMTPSPIHPPNMGHSMLNHGMNGFLGNNQPWPPHGHGQW